MITLLAFDLGVLHKDDREIGVRESLLLSGGYISVAFLFGAWVWWYLGAQSGIDYYTGGRQLSFRQPSSSQHIANSLHRENDAWIIWYQFNLTTQSANQHVNRAVAGSTIPATDVVDKIVPT